MSRILAHGHSFVSVKTVVHILEPNSGNNIPVAYARSHNNNIIIIILLLLLLLLHEMIKMK